MKKTIFIVALLVLLFSNGFAQSFYEQKWKEGAEKRSKAMDSLTNIIEGKRMIVSNLSKGTNEAVALVKERSALLDSIASDTAAINALSRRQTEILQSSENLTEFQEFGEECLCEFIKGRLCQPYNEKYIKQAIENYSGLKSAMLRKQYEPILPLLQGYGAYYGDFMKVIRTAQNDKNRTSAESKEEYRMEYISKIHQMPYYHRYYGKTWNIPYLDQEIDRALALLDKHNPGTRSRNFTIDFSYLLIGK